MHLVRDMISWPKNIMTTFLGGIREYMTDWIQNDFVFNIISLSLKRNSFANFDVDKLIDLAKLYDADFSIFIVDIRADLDFLSCSDMGDLAVRMVRSDRHVIFSLMQRYWIIFK
ncbi:hypothetical protein ACJX0J_020760, partial [Zea mays]